MTTDDPREDREPKGDGRDSPHGGKIRQTKRQALSDVKRQVTDEDLTNPTVARMLLDDVERLEEENDELRGFKERFHSSDRDAAVLRERLNASTARDVLESAFLIVGSLILGHVPSLWSSQPTGGIALAIGAIAILGVFSAKYVAKRKIQ